nr:putative magnesium transporter nipa6 [Quercus suber]
MAMDILNYNTTTRISSSLPGLDLLSDHHKSSPTVGGWSSLIGIVTAIIGNVLISFALNTQRYAHMRLSRDREGQDREERKGTVRDRSAKEAQNYGTQAQESIASPMAKDNAQDEDGRSREQADSVENSTETDALIPRVRSPGHESLTSEETVRPQTAKEKNKDSGKEKSYLRSPIWWLGIALMVVGEAGNFLAYGFAPASIVSPLGVVALISNCIIAPLVLGERFRWRDGVGVIIAVAGCVTVVLSASDSNPRLTPNSIWRLITQWEFETYLGITVFLIIVLAFLSNKYGHRTILIDLGLVGLFGGYTALSTKGIASLLSNTIWRVVTFPITYLLVAVLVFTAVMQIKYVNRALQHFNATMVIPTQFVMFTLSVIIGSAVLYRDFERETGEEAAKFVGGCALTFLGVWCITSGRSDDGEGDEEMGDDDDTISMGDDESIQIETRKRYESANKISTIMKGASTPNLRRVQTAESGPPSLMVTHDQGTGGRSAEDTITDLGPAQSAAIHSDSMAAIPQESPSRPNPPIFHATTSAPVVPTKTNLSSDTSRPRTPLNRFTSTPANVSPSPKPDTPQEQSRLSVVGLFSGPLTSPLSSSLAAIVADNLRRGIDSPSHSLRRKSSHRRRPRGNTANSTLGNDPDHTTTTLGKKPSIASDIFDDEAGDGGNVNMLGELRRFVSSSSQGRRKSKTQNSSSAATESVVPSASSSTST